VAALEKLSIDTPEQIALEFHLASVGSRFLALAIDTLIQAGAAAVLLLLALGLGLVLRPFWTGAPTWVYAAVLIGWFTLYYGYFAIFEARWNGQTPGKRTVGLRVIHTSGRPLSVYEAILRNIVRIVDQMPGIYAVGIVSVFVTERSQRLGDLAASSVVVHESVGSGETSTVEVAHRSVSAPRLGAVRLTDDEVMLIEAFLRRRHELDGVARVDTAARIATRLRTRLQLEDDGQNEPLLEQLLAEYRAAGRYR
jgi:uncharacterized RDD family membrane protein YckC